MNKLVLITLASLLFATVATKAQTNVGINTSTPDASAALDVKSTTQGLLIPRMTKVQRDAVNMVGGVSTPATGLLVYQTDDTPGFYFYNGTTWTALKGGLANGTAGGQVYITAPTSPYAPQSPQTLAGDVNLSTTGIVTIADGAITTSKIADATITTAKLNAAGIANSTTYLRGDGSWAAPVSANVNPTTYAAIKTSGISLLSLGLFPSGFRAVNFLTAERTVGSAALFSDTDNTFTIPSTGVYQIGFTFRYGSGIQASLLPNSPGVGIVRTRAGISTVIDSRPFNGANLILMSLTITEASLNSIYSFQAGDKISLGLVGSSLLDVGLLGSSRTNFFIYKISD